jgi:hypothetical protein
VAAPVLAPSGLAARESLLNERAASDDLAALYAALTAPAPGDA